MTESELIDIMHYHLCTERDVIIYMIIHKVKWCRCQCHILAPFCVANTIQKNNSSICYTCYVLPTARKMFVKPFSLVNSKSI